MKAERSNFRSPSWAAVDKAVTPRSAGPRMLPTLERKAQLTQAGVTAAAGSLCWQKKADPPLFTIAIPTFNRAGLLRKCMTSALRQTFCSFELIVSDNASEDDTPKILEQFSDERLLVIRQPFNVGAIANWNACLAAASGRYIVMVSDDDIIAPHFLGRCATVIANDADIPVIVALGDVFEPQPGIRQPAIQSRILSSGTHDGTDILLEFLRGRISPQMCTVVMRTATLRARGAFRSTGRILGILQVGSPCCFKAGPVSSTNRVEPTSITWRRRQRSYCWESD